MANDTYPLAMPNDLLSEVRETAKDTGLSMADTMRQSMKLGLPKLREQLTPTAGLKPFTKEEAARAFGPDPEWEKLEGHCAKAAIKGMKPPRFD